MAAARQPARRYPLLADGSLMLEVDPRLVEATRRWIPLGAPGADRQLRGVLAARRGDSARIAARVANDRPHSGRPAGEPSLRLGSVAGWVSPRGSALRLAGDAGCRGRVGFPNRTALIRVPAAADPEGASRDLYSMLTLSSAFLLGRLGRTLVHGGAVVSPDGDAWLLIGDSGAGKSTTTSTLARAGWDYLSDDQIVLGPITAEAIAIEGWVRPFHLDTGWWRGAPAGARVELDPSSIGPGRARGRASLGRLLFCAVHPEGATAMSPILPADALALLIRQSPWVLADPGAAPTVLELLQAVVRRPAFRLRLGLDAYNQPTRLRRILQARRVREGG